LPNLSPAGQQLIQDLSQRHGVSLDAATHMLIAVHNGNGTMAQFSHPEFGGSGQWMRGGMTMVSDLFNSHLKSRVDNICNDISNSLANHQSSPFSGSFQSQSQGGMHSQTQTAGGNAGNNSLFLPDPSTNWWPTEFGSPNATGSQNNIGYAYFAGAHRLAVKTGGEVWVYDTLNHQIGGFSQQQGSGGSIAFSSQFGTIALASLPIVSRNGVPTPPANVSPAAAQPAPAAHSHSVPAEPASAAQPSRPAQSADIFDTLERLGGLLDKGYITQDEFAAKKAELLGRL
jgi:hypothetical protein